jgi:hypothetical protein
MLGEKAQVMACKELALVIQKHANGFGTNGSTSKDSSVDTSQIANPQVLVCALLELSTLICSLGTSAHSIVSDASLSMLMKSFEVGNVSFFLFPFHRFVGCCPEFDGQLDANCGCKIFKRLVFAVYWSGCSFTIDLAH